MSRARPPGRNGRGQRARRVEVPRWAVFLLVAAAITVPLVVRIGFPLHVSEETRAVYDAIEALPPRAVVVLSFDYEPYSLPELQPMARAILRQAFARNLRVLALTHYPAGPSIAEHLLNEVAAEYGRRYGEDYVNLGFKAGNEAVVMAIGRDFRIAFPEDFRGNKTDDLPVMKGITNWKDVAVLVDVAHGATVDYYIRIVEARYGVPVSAGCTAVSIPHYRPYLQSGQLHGLIGGLQGAAEYERLVGKPDFATAGMDAQSLAHLTVIVLVILGNVSYWRERRARRTQAARRKGR